MTEFDKEFSEWWAAHQNDWLTPQEFAWAAWQAARAPQPAPAPEPVVLTWTMEVQYKHRGFQRPRFFDLGTIDSPTHADALARARVEAQRHLEKLFTEEEIENWEVRVRPAKKS